MMTTTKTTVKPTTKMTTITVKMKTTTNKLIVMNTKTEHIRYVRSIYYLLKELNRKVPVAQVLKQLEIALKLEYSGLSR